ncbi:MAG TPA: hypothetical protein VNC50_19980, partial [Planctomycetia bacterium]|nr:hypothetical protein [Planctomycetia bacterium]
ISSAAWLRLERRKRSEIAGFGCELDGALQMPGWTNVWTMPIQNRVDMLSTGVNTAVGVRILGDSLDDVVRASERIAKIVRDVPGAAGVVADPIRGKFQLEVAPLPDKVAALAAGERGSCEWTCRGVDSAADA